MSDVATDNSPAEVDPATSDRRRFKTSRVVIELGVLSIVPTGLAIGARWWWPLELFTNFRAQYAILTAVFALAFVFQKRFRWAGAFAAVCIVNLCYIAPLYVSPAVPDAADSESRPVASTGRVRLMTANVHTANRQFQRFIDYVRTEQPDVLLVMEVDDGWIDALDALKDEFPHSITGPRSDNFGIALYSRLPVDVLLLREIGPAEVPSILARVRAGDRVLTIIGTHPLPPVSTEYATGRNAQIAAAAKVVAEQKSPVVLMGDLNMTSWSPWFGDLLAATDLRDSRRGFGLHTTWPVGNPPLWITIDHVLVSKDVRVRNHRVGPDVGSDHQPVVVDVRIE